MISRSVVRTALPVLVLTCIAPIWAAYRDGFGIVPHQAEKMAIALGWPNRDMSPTESFQATSPVGYLIFQALPDHSARAFTLLHLAGIVVALMLIGFTLHRTLPSRQAMHAWRLLMLGPLFAVLLRWVGSYDAFTIVAMTLLMLAWLGGSRWGLVAAAALLGFQSFEQGVMATLAVWLLDRGSTHLGRWDERRLRVSVPWALFGLLAGKIGQAAILASAGRVSGSGRLEWVLNSEALAMNLNSAIATLPMFLWSMFAGLWIVILIFVAMPSVRRRWELGMALLIPVVASVITMDHTRVFAIVSFPLTVVLVSWYVSKFNSDAGDRQRWPNKAAVEALVWVAPTIIVWGALILPLR